MATRYFNRIKNVRLRDSIRVILRKPHFAKQLRAKLNCSQSELTYLLKSMGNEVEYIPDVGWKLANMKLNFYIVRSRDGYFVQLINSDVNDSYYEREPGKCWCGKDIPYTDFLFGKECQSCAEKNRKLDEWVESSLLCRK